MQKTAERIYMKKDTFYLIIKRDYANGKMTILPQWYKTKKDAQKSADDLTRYFHYYFSFEVITSDSVNINKMKGEMKKNERPYNDGIT